MAAPVVSLGHRGWLSFSQLSTMASCGEQYRRKYLENEQPDSWNLPAMVGSAFHKAVEILEQGERLAYDSKDFHALLTKETRRLLTHEMTANDVTEDDLVVFGAQDLKHWQGKGIPNLSKNYLAARHEELENGLDFIRDFPVPPHEVEVIEADVAFPLRGIIDQVLVDSTGRIVLRDLKTGKPKPEHAMQLELYGYLFRQQFGGMAPMYGQLMYIGQSSVKYEVVRFALRPPEVEQMLDQLRASITHEVMPITGPFNGSCGWCDFRSSCSYSSVDTRGSS